MNKKEKVKEAEVEVTETFSTRTPLVDIMEEEDGVVMEFEVPGANSESVDIEVDDHVLRVKATSSLRYNDNRIQFKREFRLNEGADEENISAATKDGILTLRIPKHERAKVHKIKVC